MALTDIHFQEGDGQDFTVEIAAGSYVGSLTDILVEKDGSQYPLVEVPQVTNNGGGNIFIMSE